MKIIEKLLSRIYTIAKFHHRKSSRPFLLNGMIKLKSFRLYPLWKGLQVYEQIISTEQQQKMEATAKMTTENSPNCSPTLNPPNT